MEYFWNFASILMQPRPMQRYKSMQNCARSKNWHLAPRFTKYQFFVLFIMKIDDIILHIMIWLWPAMQIFTNGMMILLLSCYFEDIIDECFFSSSSSSYTMIRGMWVYYGDVPAKTGKFLCVLLWRIHLSEKTFLLVEIEKVCRVIFADD